MGAETSLFKKLTIDSEVEYKCKDYSLLSAKYDSNHFSVFLFNDHNYAFDITHWKTIRHPFIVKYYDCGLFRGRKCVVTEWVQPVKPLLQQLDKEVIVSGVHNLVSALDFIHTICHSSVNNISLDSLFINRSERTDCWKLGSLLCLSTSTSETVDFCHKLLKYHSVLATLDTLPPEDTESKQIKRLENDEIYRRDTYAFGQLLSKLLADSQISTSIEQLRNVSPLKRPLMKHVLNDDLFVKSEFVKLKSFLTSFTTFNESLRNEFLNDLVDKMRQLSDELIVHLISFIVNSRLIMSNTTIQNQLLPFVLIPGNDSDEEMLYQLTSGESITLRPLLKRKVFKRRVIPLICKMYCNRDLRIRLLLLQYLPNYAPLISNGCLRQLILPQILMAVKDSNDELVSLTFKVISHLVSIFGATVVLGPRVKLFSDGLPKQHNPCDEIEIDSITSLNITDSSESDKRYENNECNKLIDSIQQNSCINDIEVQTIKTSINNNVLSMNAKDLQIKTPKEMKNNNTIESEIDIKGLDIKVEKNEIDDLFSSMEPVFKFSQKHFVGQQTDKSIKNITNMFAANDPTNDEVGWSDHSWDSESEK